MRFCCLLLRVVCALSVVAVLAGGLQAMPQSSGFHTNSRFGFKLKPPAEWEEIPVQAQEEWLVAKYLSKRKYFWTESGGGWTYEHQPELMVIAFVEEVTKKEGNKVSKIDGKQRITFKYDNPYRDYEDYLDRTYAGGGFYISKRDRGKVGDIEVTKLEIKVEKLARGGPKRITTWVYHGPGVDFAVQIEVLENHLKKLKRTVSGVHRSFKLIERTEGALPTEAGARGSWIAVFDMDKGTPEERRRTRQESEAQHRGKALAKLPDDWTAKQMGRVFVISHVEKKYSDRIAAQSNAILDWLDKTFAFIGPDEYVRYPIIRICRDDEEERSYRRGGTSGGGWYFGGLEIATNPGKNSSFNFENANVNRSLLRSWFQDRDRDLFWAFPEWLDYGLTGYVADLGLKRKKLIAKPSDWDKDELRELVREGKATKPQTLMSMTGSEFRGGTSMWNRMEEAGALVRFLLSDKALKKKRTKTVLTDYIRNLQQVIEKKKEDKTVVTKVEKPKTEEEEAEQFKKRREGWKGKEREIIDETFRLTFAGWSGRDWAAFNKAYFDSIK